MCSSDLYGAGNGLLITCYEMGSGSMVLARTLLVLSSSRQLAELDEKV